MMRWTRHTVGWAITGGIVGMLLFLLAFVCAGAGHGTMLPLILSTSPLVLVPYAGLLLGAPVFWGGVAVLAAAPRTRGNQLRFIGVMLSHCLVGTAFVCWAPSCNWEMIARTEKAIPGFFGGWLLCYCVAHFFAWWLYFGGARPADRPKVQRPERTEIDGRREQIEGSRGTVEADVSTAEDQSQGPGT